MTSFGYRSNPRYTIKECSSCRTLYTKNCVCSIGTVEDKILVPKPSKNCARCTRCGYLVDGPHCQGCALLRQELEENLVTYSPDFQNSSEPSNASTNVFQKLENANVELEFQVFNYAKENAHLKATYKNLFDSISVSRVQTETKIASLQNELQCNIYKNAKLRTQLFKKVSDQKENTQDSSKNTKFAKQPIVEILPKIGKTNTLSKPVTSNSVSKPQEPKGMNNDNMIAPGMFRISSDKVPRKAKKVPNTVSASSRTKPITDSQPSKKGINSNLNGLSSTGLDNTKTRRTQPRSNTKNDRVPSASKSG
nr:hypothetical protein [Tanacetum cinerariifolium]